jgi:hypothetical protein
MSKIARNPLYDDDDAQAADVIPDDRASKKGSKFWRRDTFRRKVQANAISSLSAVNFSPDGPYNAGEASPSLPENKVNAIEYFKKLRKRHRPKAGTAHTPSPGSSLRTSTSSFIELLPPASQNVVASSSTPSSSPTQAETPHVVTNEPEPPPIHPSPTSAWSPYDLAQRIHEMLSLGGSSQRQETKEAVGTTDKGQPNELDPALVKALCSPDAMNGAASSSNKTSVWSVLDRLISSRSSKADTIQRQRQSLYDDGSSIMLYTPLIGEGDSQVEIARSRVCSMVFEDGVDMTHLDGETIFTFEEHPTTNDGSQKAKDVKLWVPSKDKISVQTVWWGYRMCML